MKHIYVIESKDPETGEWAVSMQDGIFFEEEFAFDRIIWIENTWAGIENKMPDYRVQPYTREEKDD